MPVSLGMILVGAVFCGGSFFVLVGHGIPALLTTYRDSGWLSFAFLAFYGLAGGLTALLHVSSLVRGCPSPENAGILAIPLALALTAASVAMMEYAIASLPVASR